MPPPSLNSVELLCEVDVVEEDCSADAAEGEVLLVLVQELVQVRPLGEEPPALDLLHHCYSRPKKKKL